MAGKIKGITIEIGGDTTNLDKAMKDLGKESKNLDSQLRQINNSLKFNPGNADLIAQKQRVLAESIENTKSKIDILKQAQKEAEIAFKNGEIGAEEYEKLQREVLKAENQLENLEKKQKELNDTWKETGEKIENFGQKTSEYGQKITKGVTVPILGVGAGAMKAFSEVDEGLDTIITKTGATGKAAEGLENSFKNVYSSFPADSEEVGNAIGEVNTQFGFLGKELEDKTTLMLKFSKINGQDVTQATIQSKQAIEAFNLSGKDLDMVLDSVTKTAQNTGVSTDKLFDSVIKGAPVLQGIGLDFSTATALIGQFEQSGVDSSKAISYLTKAQANWSKEGKTMEEGLKELTSGIKNAKNEQEAISLATEVFGTKAGPMMAKAIKDGKLSFDELKKSSQEAKNSVNDTFEGTRDPIDEFKVAMNNLKIAGAELGVAIQTTLAPIAKEIIEKIKAFTMWFSNLSQNQKEMIVKIGLIVMAIGPLLIVIGKIAVGIGSILKIGGALIPLISSIGPAILGLIPILAGLLLAFLVGKQIYDHWGEIKKFFTDILTQIKDFFIVIFTNISNFFTSIWSGIFASASSIWTSLKNTCISIFTSISEFLKSIWTNIKQFLLMLWNSIKSAAQNIFSVIKNIITSIWNSIKSLTSNIWNSIKSTITGILNSIKNVFSNIFNGFKDIVYKSFVNVKNAVFNGMQNAFEVVKGFIGKFFDAGRNIVTSIADGIRSAIGWVTDAIEDVASTIRDFLPFSPAKEGPLKDLNKLNFGGTISEGIENGKKAIQYAMNEILEIPNINMSELEFKKNNQENFYTGDSIVINIEHMNAKDEGDVKTISEELLRLIQRTKRGRGK